MAQEYALVATVSLLYGLEELFAYIFTEEQGTMETGLSVLLSTRHHAWHWDAAPQWFGDRLSITLEQKKKENLSQEWARDSREERKDLAFRSWKSSFNSKECSEKGQCSSAPLRCLQSWPEERKFWKKSGKGEEAWTFWRGEGDNLA